MLKFVKRGRHNHLGDGELYIRNGTELSRSTERSAGSLEPFQARETGGAFTLSPPNEDGGTLQDSSAKEGGGTLQDCESTEILVRNENGSRDASKDLYNLMNIQGNPDLSYNSDSNVFLSGYKNGQKNRLKTRAARSDESQKIGIGTKSQYANAQSGNAIFN